MTAISKYTEAKARVNAALAEVKSVAKQAFLDSVKDLFIKHPEMESFSWSQYTPYFNDGDECVFSAHTDTELISVNGDDGYEICGSDHDYTNANGVYESVPKPREQWHPMFDAQKSVAEVLGNFDNDDYRAMFGDHVAVTVTKDAVETSEYEHD